MDQHAIVAESQRRIPMNREIVYGSWECTLACRCGTSFTARSTKDALLMWYSHTKPAVIGGDAGPKLKEAA